MIEDMLWAVDEISKSIEKRSAIIEDMEWRVEDMIKDLILTNLDFAIGR